MLLALQLLVSAWKTCVIELETAAGICREPERATARYPQLRALDCAANHSAGSTFITFTDMPTEEMIR